MKLLHLLISFLSMSYARDDAGAEQNGDQLSSQLNNSREHELVWIIKRGASNIDTSKTAAEPTSPTEKDLHHSSGDAVVRQRKGGTEENLNITGDTEENLNTTGDTEENLNTPDPMTTQESEIAVMMEAVRLQQNEETGAFELEPNNKDLDQDTAHRKQEQTNMTMTISENNEKMRRHNRQRLANVTLNEENGLTTSKPDIFNTTNAEATPTSNLRATMWREVCKEPLVRAHSSCQHKCGVRNIFHCSCDDLCVLFMDCCEDIETFCSALIRHTPTPASKTDRVEKPRMQQTGTTVENETNFQPGRNQKNLHGAATTPVSPTSTSFYATPSTNTTMNETHGLAETSKELNSAMRFSTTTSKSTAATGSDDRTRDIQLFASTLSMECIDNVLAFRGCASPSLDDVDVSLLEPMGLTLTAEEVVDRCLGRTGKAPISWHDFHVTKGTRRSGLAVDFVNVFCAVCSGSISLTPLSFLLRCTRQLNSTLDVSAFTLLNRSASECFVFWLQNTKSCLQLVPLPTRRSHRSRMAKSAVSSIEEEGPSWVSANDTQQEVAATVVSVTPRETIGDSKSLPLSSLPPKGREKNLEDSPQVVLANSTLVSPSSLQNENELTTNMNEVSGTDTVLLAELCELYTSYVNIQGKWYRNKYCYILTENSVADSLCRHNVPVSGGSHYMYTYVVDKLLLPNKTNITELRLGSRGTNHLGNDLSNARPHVVPVFKDHLIQTNSFHPMYTMLATLQANFTESTADDTLKYSVGSIALANFTRDLVRVMENETGTIKCAIKDAPIMEMPESLPHQWSQRTRFSCHVIANETSQLPVLQAEVTDRIKAVFSKVSQLADHVAVIKVRICIWTHLSSSTEDDDDDTTATMYCSQEKTIRLTGRRTPTTGVASSGVSAHGYVSIACCLLSEVALVVRVALQNVIPFYNSFPGRIQLCLCLSLLLSYAFFLLGGLVPTGGVLCIGLGMLTHLGFLSALCWMNVTAYEIWRTFRKWENLVKSRGSWSLFWRGLIAVGLPLLLSGSCLLLDLLVPSSPASPQYGRPHCWINTPYALVWYFAAPCSLICLVNAILAGLTVCNLRRHRENRELKMQSHFSTRVNEIAISFKLLVLVGITWLLGLLAAVVDAEVLWFIFTIANASLGFLISATLLCNRRVWATIKDALCPPSTGLSLASSGQTANSRI